MSVTIREIAKELGLSPSTVSQALNNKGSLRLETRERVRQAARRMGYYALNDPFGIDPTLSGRPLWMIVPVASTTDDFTSRPVPHFRLRVVEGIRSALEPYKVTPLFVAEGEIRQGQPRNLVATLVLGGYIREDTIKFLEQLRTPVVSVASRIPSNSICSVAPDAVAAIRKAVDHLGRLGHEHIAFLNGPLTTPSSDDKLTGFVRGMYDLGKPADRVVSLGNPFSWTNVERVVALLKGPWKRVTAIVCAYKSTVRFVVKAAQSLGYRVPDDLSIAAYDEHGVDTVDSSVTAFGVFADMLGRSAVSLAFSVRANSELIGTSLVVNPQLTSSGSTAPANVKKNSSRL